MKNVSYYTVLCFFILLASCHEKEDPLSSRFIGTWEMAALDESIDLEGVISYIFRPDGTYSYQIFYREPGESLVLGYQLIWNGIFNASAQELTLRLQETFYARSNTTFPFAKLEDMVIGNFTPGAKYDHPYHILDDGDKLVLLYEYPALDLHFNKVK